ncbi:AAA family ATPase [Desulfovibrio piger]|nr:AAA family ATPase [Desulfovibrio piger]
MAEIALLDKVWTEFLTRWPVEKVRSMTLEQYHKLNDSSCFQRCLESGAGKLGSIWGGTAFKFGIYQRANKDENKQSGQGYTYGDVYAWLTKLGATPEEAFAAVKRAILSIIDAIRSRDLEGVQRVQNLGVLWPMVVWKIAFLYQDRSNPQIVFVFTREKLLAALDEPNTANLGRAELYRRIMERRAGKNLHVYSEEIWTMRNYDAAQPSAASASSAPVSPTKIPLNQILYGPPGTGKTYATVEKALEIFAQAGLRDIGATDTERRRCFDKLMRDGHIRFVTFHQSFCYEDFVEGIRAATDDDGKISYEVKDGIFKELCAAARSRTERPHRQSVDLTGRTIWKMSLGNTQGDDAYIYEECLRENCLLMGYGGSVDFSSCQTPEKVQELFMAKLPDQLKDSSHPVQQVTQFCLGMQPGDIVIVSDGNHKFRAIGEVCGAYLAVARKDDSYGQRRDVKWLCTFSPSRPVEELLDKNFSQKTLYRLADTVIRRESLARLLQVERAEEEDSLPYVLIIDEINRGNVSRIFGELITLLEDSHRASLDKDSYQRDTVTVRLPYSRDFFSVPENIYIIGTMNTADQSLTGLDIALRRRFAFTEMAPRSELLENRRLEGTTVTLGDVLDCLNQRIAALLDKEHCLGHAYFMRLGASVSVAELSDVFKKHIMPLLEEYFFADWEKIQWVLNDHRKTLSSRFVIREEGRMAQLFGDDVRLPESAESWRWNLSAFEDMNAYVQIVDAGMAAESLDEDGENQPQETE